MTASKKPQIDGCESIEVTETQGQPKLCQTPSAAVEGRWIFLGGGKWKIKQKELTEVQLEVEEMVLKTATRTITMKQVDQPNEHEVEQWDCFRRQVQRMFDKVNGKSSHKGVFGSSKTSKSRKSVNRRPETLWDDAPLSSEKRPSHDTLEFDRSSSLAPREFSPKRGNLQSDDDESAAKPRGKRLKKGFRNHFFIKHLTSDSEDAGLFDDVKFTTPAVQRIVSPSSRSGQHKSGDPVLGSEEEENDEKLETVAKNHIKLLLKDKSPIIAAPRTPPRRTAKGNGLVRASTSSKYFSRPTSSVNVANAAHDEETLFSTQSPTRPSSFQKHGEVLFGSSHKRSRPIEEDDPIEELKSTPRQRLNLLPKFSRPRLKLKDTERQLKVYSPHRPKFRGLVNLRNTCYMNASLQMLFTCQSFMTSLSQYSQSRLTKSVYDLYSKMHTQHQAAAAPRDIKETIDTKTAKFQGYEQRDAHEFLADLLDHVHEELAEVTKDRGDVKDDDGPEKDRPEVLSNPIPTDEFCLTVKARLRCTTCKYDRCQEEIHRCLSIDVFDGNSIKASVDKGLSGFFEPEEREVTCEKCEHGRRATQTFEITSKPKYLLLHLKRFMVVEQPATTAENQEPNSPGKTAPPVEYIVKKNKAPVSIPQSLSLDAFIDNQGSQEEGLYNLQSVVHHLGRQSSSGHYTADAIRRDQDASGGEKKVWVCFDDANSGETTYKEATEGRKGSTAYLLLYELGGANVAEPTAEELLAPESSPEQDKSI